MRRTLLLLLIALTLSACANLGLKSGWPESIPPKSIFVEAYQDPNGKPTLGSKELDATLMWIKRFYLGSIFYPIGWNHTTESLLSSLEDRSQVKDISQKMNRLGIKIGVEWAKSNIERKIDSSNVSIWGNALRKAAEQQEQAEFIDKVEKDVDALLKGTLTAAEVSSDRYYPEEDYDDF